MTSAEFVLRRKYPPPKISSAGNILAKFVLRWTKFSECFELVELHGLEVERIRRLGFDVQVRGHHFVGACQLQIRDPGSLIKSLFILHESGVE